MFERVQDIIHDSQVQPIVSVAGQILPVFGHSFSGERILQGFPGTALHECRSEVVCMEELSYEEAFRCDGLA